MRSKMIKRISILLISYVITACSATPISEEFKYDDLKVNNKDVYQNDTDIGYSYIKEIKPKIIEKKISLNGDFTVIEALQLVQKGINVIPMSDSVDLDQKYYFIADKLNEKKFLEYVSTVTGYEIIKKDSNLLVNDFIERKWNLAEFSTQRKVKLKVGNAFSSGGSSNGSDNNIQGSYTDDEWQNIVDGARAILINGNKNDLVDQNRRMPYLQAVRSLGTIVAGGPVNKINSIDKFLSNLNEQGRKQININVQAYDVILSDSRSTGIDWNELATVGASLNGNPLDINLSSKNTIINNSDSLFDVNASYESDSLTADAVFKFLSQYGDVELLNQPNVTVRNGTYAYISTGEEFTFVGQITSNRVDSNGGLTPSLETVESVDLETIRVGVTLAVTPKLLDDGKIMLDIWPVISSQTGEDEYTFSNESFTVPRIALNELSTQVITESGDAIQLGGFIRRSIAKKLEDLPWKSKLTNKLINPLFKSELDEVQRRELVLTVIPTIVE